MNAFDPLAWARPNIQQLKAYSSARDEAEALALSGKPLFMDANENPYAGALGRYPDPTQQRLRERLADEKNCLPSQLIFGNGSDELIDLLIRIFCEPKQDELLICPPTYGMYEVCAAIADVDCIKCAQKKDFELDVPAIKAAISPNTKLIFLCSPNNPTGKSIPQDQLIELLACFDGLVVLDEAYIDFVAGKTALGLLESYPNLVILQTFSKARGLAGIRLGVAFGSSALIELMMRVKMPYNINALSASKALESLGQKTEYREMIDRLVEERSRLEMGLQANLLVDKVYPSDANFLLVKFQQAELVFQRLWQVGIVLRRTKEYACEGCLRISVGTPKENTLLLQELNKLATALVLKTNKNEEGIIY